MRLLLDSSALAKRYISEPGTETVILRCQEADEIVLSNVCVPEVISGLNRLRREGRLSGADYELLKEDFLADVEEATVIGFSPEVLRTTVSCLETVPLRALDAIQVATAVESECDLFLSADRRQCRAAAVMQLRVGDLSALGNRARA